MKTLTIPLPKRMKSSDRNQKKGKEDMNLESFLELFRVEFHLLYHVRIVPFALLCLNCLNIRRCNISALHMRALDSTSLTYSFG